MSKSFTYKQKFFGIVLGFIILLLASYKKTYKHVFEAKAQISLVNDKLQNVDNSYNEIFILKNEISSLDNIIGGHSKNPEQVQQMILDFVSNSEYDVDISSIDDTHLFSDNEFRIYTNTIEIEGTYFDLMTLFYDIEKEFNMSKIVSAKLFSIKNYRTNSKRLYLKLIFQNYEKNK
ncbi:hypothetical protein [Psychroserpens algicola]|uniref:Type IV pilus assembly protein PilO n=1 Tax=Psychroserpens algicola TaxID=1719034 RepID=A0ABT0HCX6_9FLAO|nr:hypothetical protein [Psychroserpens algicola]MCK8482226.1 hypothetical protein [Psychroserpens algicola]